MMVTAMKMTDHKISGKNMTGRNKTGSNKTGSNMTGRNMTGNIRHWDADACSKHASHSRSSAENCGEGYGRTAEPSGTPASRRTVTPYSDAPSRGAAMQCMFRRPVQTYYKGRRYTCHEGFMSGTGLKSPSKTELKSLSKRIRRIFSRF